MKSTYLYQLAGQSAVDRITINGFAKRTAGIAALACEGRIERFKRCSVIAQKEIATYCEGRQL